MNWQRAYNVGFWGPDGMTVHETTILAVNIENARLKFRNSLARTVKMGLEELPDNLVLYVEAAEVTAQ